MSAIAKRINIDAEMLKRQPKGSYLPVPVSKQTKELLIKLSKEEGYTSHTAFARDLIIDGMQRISEGKTA